MSEERAYYWLQHSDELEHEKSVYAGLTVNEVVELKSYVFNCWRDGLKEKEILAENPKLNSENLQVIMCEVMQEHFSTLDNKN